MERFSSIPRALAVVSAIVGVSAIVILYLGNRVVTPACDPPMPIRSGAGVFGSASCWNGEFGAASVSFPVQFLPTFEPHFILVGVVAAAVTYALLVLVLQSVRAMRGRG